MSRQLDGIVARAREDMRERTDAAFLGETLNVAAWCRRWTYRTDPLRIVDTKTGEEIRLDAPLTT